MVGLPIMAAIAGPSWLMEIRCQSSYPLNSEKASPFGTLTAYFPASDDGPGFAQASTPVIIVIASITVLFFIATILGQMWSAKHPVPHSSHEGARRLDVPQNHLAQTQGRRLL